jgi:hypothetical protein
MQSEPAKSRPLSPAVLLPYDGAPDSPRHQGVALLARAARLAAVNLLVLLVLLIPLELVFGDWFSPSGAITLLNVAPNTLTIKPSPLYPAGTTITYHRDRYGLRGPGEDPAHIDILAIGGSTTNERLLAEDDTWTARLAALLRQHDCPLSIANAGVDGYTTQGHIASFNGWFDRIPGLKPRFVLAYVGLNDIALDPNAPTLLNSKQDNSTPRRFVRYVAANSAVHRLYSQLRGWWHARQAGLLHGEVPIPPDAVWVPVSLPDGFAADAAKRASGFRKRLEQLNARIRAFGARPVYITQRRVDARQVDGAWQEVKGSGSAVLTAIVQALNRETLAFCRDSGESCIDLAGQLGFQPGDFYDAMHTTLAGSARIAGFLAPRLLPILCPRAP